MELKQAANKQVPVYGYGGEVQRSVPKDTTKEPSTALVTAAQPETPEEARIRLLYSVTSKQWQKVGIRHHHGVAQPVFSLRTQNSFGCGEYLDLLQLIDFCTKNGFDMIQVLPLCDTGARDPSPFSPISALAMNPALISISQVPVPARVSTHSMHNALLALRRLNERPCIAWDQVRQHKMSYLKDCWCLTREHNLKQGAKSNSFLLDYEEWRRQNDNWVIPHALFASLKNQFQGQSWERWPEREKEAPEHPQTMNRLLEEFNEEIEFYCWLQYICHSQMSKVRDYAKGAGVLLKADVPFLVSRDSADVWLHRELFDLTVNVGAAPDVYSAAGQNWGTPAYRWDAFAETGYAWWKHRIRLIEQYFDLYRIDHVVGFYRTWVIPLDVDEAANGEYRPDTSNLDVDWVSEGEDRLKLIASSSTMLPIAEDLGIVPDAVRASLRKLGICSTKVIRWERRWGEKGAPFVDPSEYNLDSMTTVSTHDTEPCESWWVDRQEEAGAYCEYKGWEYDETQPFPTEYRKRLLSEAHHSNSLFHINLLSEYLALDPTLLHEDRRLERINDPAKAEGRNLAREEGDLTRNDSAVQAGNWTYRMKSGLEEVSDDQKLCTEIKQVLRG